MRKKCADLVRALVFVSTFLIFQWDNKIKILSNLILNENIFSNQLAIKTFLKIFLVRMKHSWFQSSAQVLQNRFHVFLEPREVEGAVCRDIFFANYLLKRDQTYSQLLSGLEYTG